MPETPKDNDLEETKRIMERLVNTPPKPHDSGKAKEKADDKRAGDRVKEGQHGKN